MRTTSRSICAATVLASLPVIDVSVYTSARPLPSSANRSPLTSTTGRCATVTATVPAAPPLVAVTFATPLTPSAATKSPVGPTCPSDGGATDHVTGAFRALSNWSFRTAVSCALAPLYTIVLGDEVTIIVGAGVVLTVAASPSYAIAPSPPANESSTTVAATLPPCASTTTAYCVSSSSPGTPRGSTRMVAPADKPTTCCRVMSRPSAKRYQRNVALVAPADCSRMGVVQPLGPPSVRVTFGRYARLPGLAFPTKPNAVVEPTAIANTANWPPLTVADHSPSGSDCASKDHERPGPIGAGAAIEVVPPPRRSSSEGVAGDAPVFSTTSRVVRPSTLRAMDGT